MSILSLGLVLAQLGLPIPGEWVVNIGASGLLIIVALLVFTGRLVPRRTYDDMVQDRDYWREIAIKSAGHTEKLLPAAHIASQVSRAFAVEVLSDKDRT